MQLYSMEVITFTDLKGKLIFKTELPGSWDELTEKQFKKIYKYLYATPGKPDYIKNRLKVCFILLLSRTRNPFLKLWIIFKVHFKLHALQVYDLCEAIKFLFDSFPSKAFIKSFWYQGVRYYLPDDCLENSTLVEYTYADSYLARFNEDKTFESLNKLVATLCRPQKLFWQIRRKLPDFNTGDRREKFNAQIMLARAPKFNKLSIHTKLMVLYFFVGSKLEIINTYKHLFPKPKEEEEGEGSDWLEVMNDVAKTRLYGDYNSSAYYNLHIILTNLDLDQKKIIESTPKR